MPRRRASAKPDPRLGDLVARATAAGTKVGFVRFGAPKLTGLVELTPAAARLLTPFASVPCGDVLALLEGLDAHAWVVVFGAHGEAPRAFPSVASFVASWAASKTGVPDLDDAEGGASSAERARLLGARGRGGAPTARAAEKVARWLSASAPARASADPAALERIRAQIERLVLREARRLPPPLRWTRGLYTTYRLEYVRATGTATWMAGMPRPFPELAPLLEELGGTFQRKSPVTTTAFATDGTLFPDPRTAIRKPARV
ncbi:MAG: hypothetical protein U0234_29505 [Sandaracinus sp.]